jgi:hypothetical protein
VARNLRTDCVLTNTGSQDAPLCEWAGKDRCDPGYREEYLLELLRIEGRGGNTSMGACRAPPRLESTAVRIVWDH